MAAPERHRLHLAGFSIHEHPQTWYLLLAPFRTVNPNDRIQPVWYRIVHVEKGSVIWTRYVSAESSLNGILHMGEPGSRSRGSDDRDAHARRTETPAKPHRLTEPGVQRQCLLFVYHGPFLWTWK